MQVNMYECTRLIVFHNFEKIDKVDKIDKKLQFAQTKTQICISI